ncbi:MAG: PaaI family thioesterase [Firmicutes bacterium]|nr:PaaI family thioesterase [Bacillota bacterium]
MDQEMRQLIKFASDNPFAKILNIEIREMERGKGESCLEITVAPIHLNSQETMHGGVLSAMADIAMGVAIRTLGKVVSP